MILALALLFGLGLTARYIQRQAHPLPADAYAEAEILFQQASEAPPAEPVEQALPTPTAEPSSKSTTYQPKSALPAGSINLNTATASELQRLPSAQRERIESPEFYELLQRTISTRYLAEKPPG